MPPAKNKPTAICGAYQRTRKPEEILNAQLRLSGERRTRTQTRGSEEASRQKVYKNRFLVHSIRSSPKREEFACLLEDRRLRTVSSARRPKQQLGCARPATRPERRLFIEQDVAISWTRRRVREMRTKWKLLEPCFHRRKREEDKTYIVESSAVCSLSGRESNSNFRLRQFKSCCGPKTAGVQDERREDQE